MKLAEAAEQWIEAKTALRLIEAQLKTAEADLKAHFRKSPSNVYKGKIGYSCTTYSTLDTDAVKNELGDRLAKFQISRTRETLSLLG